VLTTCEKGWKGFTLVEIIIVIGLLGLLLAVAVPGFRKIREQGNISETVNTLRVLKTAFEDYATIHRGYPPDALHAHLPSGIEDFLPDHFEWDAETPVGGYWDWEGHTAGFAFSFGISIKGSSASLSVFRNIDKRIDDGNLATGSFKQITSGAGDPSQSRYTFILQEDNNDPWGVVP
jgi:prepilin-type N-terminal cleavage/methylation domain-containing protein